MAESGSTNPGSDLQKNNDETKRKDSGSKDSHQGSASDNEIAHTLSLKKGNDGWYLTYGDTPFDLPDKLRQYSSLELDEQDKDTLLITDEDFFKVQFIDGTIDIQNLTEPDVVANEDGSDSEVTDVGDSKVETPLRIMEQQQQDPITGLNESMTKVRNVDDPNNADGKSTSITRQDDSANGTLVTKAKEKKKQFPTEQNMNSGRRMHPSESDTDDEHTKKELLADAMKDLPDTHAVKVGSGHSSVPPPSHTEHSQSYKSTDSPDKQHAVRGDEVKISQTKSRANQNTHAADAHPLLDSTEVDKIKQLGGTETNEPTTDGTKGLFSNMEEQLTQPNQPENDKLENAAHTHPPLDSTEADRINRLGGTETNKLNPDGIKGFQNSGELFPEPNQPNNDQGEEDVLATNQLTFDGVDNSVSSTKDSLISADATTAVPDASGSTNSSLALGPQTNEPKADDTISVFPNTGKHITEPDQPKHDEGENYVLVPTNPLTSDGAKKSLSSTKDSVKSADPTSDSDASDSTNPSVGSGLEKPKPSPRKTKYEGHSDPRASPDRGDQQSTQKSPIPSPRPRGQIDTDEISIPPELPPKGAHQPRGPGIDVQQNTVPPPTPLPRSKGNRVAGSEMQQTGTNSTMQKPLPVKQIGQKQDKPIVPGGEMGQTDTNRTNQSDPPSRPGPSQGKPIVPGGEILQTDTNNTVHPEPSSRPGPRQDKPIVPGGAMGQTDTNSTNQSEPSSRPGPRQDKSIMEGAAMGQPDTDSTLHSEPSSAVTGPTKQEVEVRYTRDNREKTLDAVFECSHDKFMRLQYMLGHPSLFKKKCEQLKTQNVPDISIDEQKGRKLLVINVGVITDIVSEPEKEQLIKKVVEEVLKDTGNLEVNSFPTSGIDKDKAASMMKERSEKAMDHDLWLYADEESDCIHYVYPKSRVHHVEGLRKEVIDMCLIGEIKLELDLVYFKVLDHLKVKDKVKEQYEERVTMAVDQSESKDKCVVILSGRWSDVKAAGKMISEKCKEEFTTSKLSFGDIKKLEPGHKIEQIIRDAFEKPDFVDAYWYVNDTHKKISVCCKTGCQADKIIWALKSCLKGEKVQPEHQQKIAENGVIPSGTFVMELKGDELEVVGTENAIDKIKQLISDSQKKEDKKPTSQPETFGATRKVSECTAAGMGLEKRPDKDANEREKKGDKGMIQKSPHVVDEPNIFEMLCASSELFNFAKENNVRLEPLRGKKLAIMVCGIQPSVKKIKDKIDDLVKEFKEREVSPQAEAAKIESERNKKIGSAGGSAPDTVSVTYKRFWDLNYGHRVAIHPSMTCPGDFAQTVHMETVPPQQATFEIPNKLNLPRWTGGTHQERVLAKETFKDLMEYCSGEAFHNIKIEMWEIEKKILQFFVIGMFEVLSQKIGAPMTIVICTDGGELYTRLAEFCDGCQQRGSSITRQDRLYPSLPDSEEDLDRTTSEDDATTSCMTVEIIRGQLNCTKADAIVNTTGKDLQLKTGNVSKALLKSAGDGIQQEVKYLRPNGINYGEIVTTRSFNLQNCRCVLHGALEGYNGKDLKNLHKFVNDCMVEAERQGCASIAFPAIGTGNLGFPKSGVAKTMFEAVRGFENRRQRLKEVKFVLYQLDTETIQAFEKEEKLHVKLSKETIQSKADLRYIGQTSVHVKFGTLKDIINTGIIYVWEKGSTYNLRPRDNDLLREAGTTVQRSFTSHRDNKNTRETTLKTAGGDLPVPFIVHVFSKDNMTSLKESLMEEFYALSTEDTVCVFFDKKSKFIRYGPHVVDALVKSIKEVQTSLPTLRHVQMIVEMKSIALGMLAHLYTVVDGRKPPALPPKGQLLQEPGTQSMGPRAGNEDDPATKWRMERDQYLKGISKDYYQFEQIPSDSTDIEIRTKVEEILPVGAFDVIFIPGRTTALIKITGYFERKKKILETDKLKKLPVQALQIFTKELDREIDGKLINTLNECDVDASSGNGKTEIKAPTRYHLDWALNEIGGQKKRHKKDSDSFIQIEPCSKDVWDIARTLKSKHIETLKQRGVTITYNETIGLEVQGVKSKSDDPEFTAVLSGIEHLRKMEITEVLVQNENNIDRINGWCNEIARTMDKTECCVYVKDRGAVLAFHLSFDKLQDIKHQILVKDGQIKVTGRRRRRDFKETDNEGCSNTTEDLSGRKNQDPVHETQEKRRMQARNPEFDLKIQAQNLQAYTTDESIKVFVYKANILKLPVDCIVNAANDTLQHGGGVARVIAQAAGRKLDQEGFDHLNRYGKVPVGQACVTTAGKLHYDCVIHAVGPRWSDYFPHSFEDVRTCERLLHSALTESFLAAENRGLKSIALPAISAAIFAVPEEVCVYHYAKATIDYSRRNSPNALEEIHFIDINPSIVNRIQNMFTTLLRNHENPHYSTEKFVKTRNQNYSWDFPPPARDYGRNRNSPTGELNRNRRSPGKESDMNRHSPGGKPDMEPNRNIHSPGKESDRNIHSPYKDGGLPPEVPGRKTDTVSKIKPTYYKIDGSHVFETDKCKLVIQKGDIMTVKAEAIVSIEDAEGSGRGKIAKLIYEAIDGHNRRYFNDDKKVIFVKNTKPGDVYKTNGYGSGFGEILHAVVPYDIRIRKPDDRKDVIKLTLQNILEVLSEYRIESVVMCLIGAGAETKTDVKIAADALCQVYTQTTVEFIKPLEITLVCRTKEALDTVIETFGQHGLTKEASPDTHPPSVPPRPNKPPALEPGNVEVSMEEDCVICMEKITERKVLKCGHAFDKDCIDQCFKVKKVCPKCGAICGIITGDQPEGTMDYKTEVWSYCAGYSGCGRITISYNFPSGRQGADHPSPGKWYKGISRKAYLPDNKDGREILEMLKIAWKRKVTFTIGNSRTTGEEGVITWNDIHFKTDPRPNTQFGYPDATYLERVKDELAAKGITPKDIEYQ